MTNLDALVSISQTLLRVRGEWWDGQRGEDILLDDIRAVVADVWKLMRDDDDTIIAKAVDELWQRVPCEADGNPFHPESPEGRAWERGDRSSVNHQ